MTKLKNQTINDHLFNPAPTPLELKHGQALVIIGPQGSGKTTRAIEIAEKHGTYELRFMNELLSNTRSRYFPDERNTVIVEEAFFDVESLVKIKEVIAAKNAPFFIFPIDSQSYPIEMTTSRRFKFIDINSVDLSSQTAFVGTTFYEEHNKGCSMARSPTLLSARNIYRVPVILKEHKHYRECYDTIEHPLITEAFLYGDLNGSGYDSLEWNGEIYEAEAVRYADGRADVYVGEWLGSADNGR
ncbi:MAG: hypothetical protein ACH255_03190 [Candidatus Thiodiazotropha sp.]